MAGKKTRKFNGKVYTLVFTSQNKVEANKRARGIRGDEYGSLARVTFAKRKMRGAFVESRYYVWKRKGSR